MSKLDHAPDLKRRAALMFLGYFPTWQMFSKDITTVRDLRDPKQQTEEGLVSKAIDILADIIGRSHGDLQGQYAAVQHGGPASDPARNDLIACYDTVYAAYHNNHGGAG